MKFIGDYTAEFKRGPDKKPRKRRGGIIRAGVAGGIAGTGAGALGRRILNNRMEASYLKGGEVKNKQGAAMLGLSTENTRAKMKRTAPSAYRAMLDEYRIESAQGGKGIKSLIKSRPVATGTALGIGAGVAGYGAYRGIKALRNRRKR